MVVWLHPCRRERRVTWARRSLLEFRSVCTTVSAESQPIFSRLSVARSVQHRSTNWKGGSVTRTSSCGLRCNRWLGTILSVSTRPLKPALRLLDPPLPKSRSYSVAVPGRSKSSSRAAKANSSSRKPFGNVPPALTSIVVFGYHALGGKWGESASLLLPYWLGRFGDSAFAHASLNSLLSEA